MEFSFHVPTLAPLMCDGFCVCVFVFLFFCFCCIDINQCLSADRFSNHVHHAIRLADRPTLQLPAEATVRSGKLNFEFAKWPNG